VRKAKRKGPALPAFELEPAPGFYSGERFIVKRGGYVRGVIEKEAPRPGFTFPWKAWVSFGRGSARYVGSYFGPSGRAAAVRAIETAEF
jgi:hypothetical protein